MDKHSEYTEPGTPNVRFNCSAEDSGYNTSFTPGSLEYSDATNDNYYSVARRTYREETTQTPDFILQNVLNVKSTELKNDSSPYQRRGTKRSHPDESETTDIGYHSLLTPTSNISGELDRLKFSDSKKCNRSTNSTNLHSSSISIQHEPCSSDSHYYDTIPKTPIKRKCKNGCKINSPETKQKLRKSLSMVMHSISCDKNALEFKNMSRKKKPETNHKFKPHQKVDIIKRLHDENIEPVITQIFNYLSNDDIFHFNNVSREWQEVWEHLGGMKRREEYSKYLKDKKERKENILSILNLRDPHICKPLVDIENLYNKDMAAKIPVSPTKSPRTRRFERFTKAALLDSRRQLACMKCQLPAKIKEEISGEEWAECTNLFCLFQFCSLCKSPRHPGKKCIQFDLDGPSPSKRAHRKGKCVAASKKSRQILKRLNF